MRVGSYFLGSDGDSAGKDADLNTAVSILLRTLSTLRPTPFAVLSSTTGLPTRRLEEAIELLKGGGMAEVTADGSVKLTDGGEKARYLVAG